MWSTSARRHIFGVIREGRGILREPMTRSPDRPTAYGSEGVEHIGRAAYFVRTRKPEPRREPRPKWVRAAEKERGGGDLESGSL
jgi:hypothetical protein